MTRATLIVHTDGEDVLSEINVTKPNEEVVITITADQVQITSPTEPKVFTV